MFNGTRGVCSRVRVDVADAAGVSAGLCRAVQCAAPKRTVTTTQLLTLQAFLQCVCVCVRRWPRADTLTIGLQYGLHLSLLLPSGYPIFSLHCLRAFGTNTVLFI
jgi:hypothetical protein